MQVPPFNKYLGVEVVRREDGTAEAVLDLEPHHLNRRGVAHGGVVLALLDSALGSAVIASIPEAWWCATTSLSTQFVDGAGRGKLVAAGRVVRRGRSVAFATGEVRDDAGRLIATASGTWHLWDHRPGRTSEPPAAGHVAIAPRGRHLKVGKILAVGRNYTEHVREMGAPEGGPPVVFFKPNTSLIHNGARVVPPADAGEVHHEVELVAVVGKKGKAIAEEHALDHVLGFAVGLDLTLRDVQKAAKRRGEPWALAKGFDGAAPVSTVVPRDAIGDGSGLEITLEVNGEVRQRGNTSQMIRPVAKLVAWASRWVTLEPGDLLFTGTPAGVGPVVAGDRLRARIEKVGELSVEIG